MRWNSCWCAIFSGLGVMELEWGALKRFLPTALFPKFRELAHKADEAGADGDGFEQLQRWLEELMMTNWLSCSVRH